MPQNICSHTPFAAQGCSYRATKPGQSTSIELRAHPGLVLVHALFSFARRPVRMFAFTHRPIRSGLALEQDAVRLQHHKPMVNTRRQVHTQAIPARLQHSLVGHRPLLVEEQQAQATLEHDQRFGFVIAQVPMRRDIGARLQPDCHAVARLFHLMEIVMLPPARVGCSLCGQPGEQRLVDERRLAHDHSPFTAKMPLALRQ